MDIILYNPLSRNGKNIKYVKKLTAYLIKQNRQVETYSLLEIDDVDQFVLAHQTSERVIIVGGDGTLNRFANRIYGLDIKQDIYMYQAGTGNDFIRSLKTKKKLVPIKQYLANLPKVIVNNQEQLFLNGAGLGLDGYVGYLVNAGQGKKNKANYFKNAFIAFKRFKPIEAEIEIDGLKIHEKKVWMTCIMNSPYFGGGMKIAPKAKRLDKDLQLVVVKNVPKWILVLIFPTIYLGWHVIFKRWVKFYQGNQISIHFKKGTYMQIDGDEQYPIQDIKATKSIDQ